MVQAGSGCTANERADTPGSQSPAGSSTPASNENEALDLQAVAAEMSRFLLGDQRVAGGRGGTAAVIGVERFVNHTQASNREFASFRQRFVSALRESGRSWGLIVEPASASRSSRYELHAAVMPLSDRDDEQWLVRLVVVGPDASGGRQTLWSDTLLADAW